MANKLSHLTVHIHEFMQVQNEQQQKKKKQ